MTWPAWGAMGIVLLATVLLPAQTVSKIAPYPFLLSLVFLGLPHGAWDHRVFAAAHGTAVSWRHLTAVCAVYGSLVVLYGALWFAAPALAFVLFILQSWLHWGQGDAAYLRLWLPGRSGTPAWLTWLVRGGAPILLPIFRFPEEFARIAAGVSGLFGPQRAANWLLPPWVCSAGMLLLAVLVGPYVILLFRPVARNNPGYRAAAWEDAAEIALLYAVFCVANPVLAVGIYFCCWHGLRHIGRLLLLDETNRMLCAGGRVATAGARFAWQCLPILVAALALLGCVYEWAIRTGGGDGSDTGLFVYLALIACLTFPHFLLVCWLDERQRRDLPLGRPGRQR
ncbi:MAG: Brp/Blh family beta-carotene 15,15'-dioxygenase [Akkermansiaceae bacterium]|nr:Brp/Blh family beta-carotene 15,15'-dioxygenase [Armatimonadota bacterium]